MNKKYIIFLLIFGVAILAAAGYFIFLARTNTPKLAYKIKVYPKFVETLPDEFGGYSNLSENKTVGDKIKVKGFITGALKSGLTDEQLGNITRSSRPYLEQYTASGNGYYILCDYLNNIHDGDLIEFDGEIGEWFQEDILLPQHSSTYKCIKPKGEVSLVAVESIKKFILNEFTKNIKIYQDLTSDIKNPCAQNSNVVYRLDESINEENISIKWNKDTNEYYVFVVFDKSPLYLVFKIKGDANVINQAVVFGICHLE